jgi:pyridoxal phosphate enzyme (YggS family)
MIDHDVIDPAALRARLASVRDRIAQAAGRAGRDPASIRLVAVSKTFSADHVRVAAEAGQLDFGENKVQEGVQKIEAFHKMQALETTDAGRGTAIRWHLVGHLQTNKTRKAAARFDVVQSVDTAFLVARLDEAAREARRQVELLVQVDLAGEPTKHGAREQELPPIFEAARRATSVKLVGLMLLPPAVADPSEARPYFRALRAVRDRLLSTGVPDSELRELSMGMSHDFEVAIEEGATLVRVGSAIFGARNSH